MLLSFSVGCFTPTPVRNKKLVIPITSRILSLLTCSQHLVLVWREHLHLPAVVYTAMFPFDFDLDPRTIIELYLIPPRAFTTSQSRSSMLQYRPQHPFRTFLRHVPQLVRGMFVASRWLGGCGSRLDAHSTLDTLSCTSEDVPWLIFKSIPQIILQRWAVRAMMQSRLVNFE